MKVSQLLNQDKVTLSFEVFPPKTSSSYESVAHATQEIAALRPDFMSVTYGAGGGTSEHTAHDGRLYQPSIPDWCFQRNRTHTMYYPQLYAKIAEETQLRLFFILWIAVNRKSLFTLTLILNFPFLSSSSSSAFQRYRPAAPPKAARPAECRAISPDSPGSSRR